MKTAENVRLACAIAACALLQGCGGLKGTYSGGERSFFESLTFKSGGTVEVTFAGMTKEGTYKQEDGKVKITVGGDTQVFTRDSKGCLDGGGFIGTYCRGGSGSERASSLSGTYHAGDGRESITVQFRDDKKVRITVSASGESRNGTYDISGNRITVRIPGGESLTFQRIGEQLVAKIDGQSVSFVRQ